MAAKLQKKVMGLGLKSEGDCCDFIFVNYHGTRIMSLHMARDAGRQAIHERVDELREQHKLERGECVPLQLLQCARYHTAFPF